MIRQVRIYNLIERLRRAIRREGTPAVQEAWENLEPHVSIFLTGMDQMELQERMAATTKGQVTWADPAKGMKCTTCAHLQNAAPSELGANKMLKNRCALVKLHTKKKGQLFNGKLAIACSMFSM